MSLSPESECPDSLRRAFLDLLACSLIHIRNAPEDKEFCFSLADHMHNVPGLLADFRPELLRYYWEVERECFLRALEAIDRRPPVQFLESWGVVEREYRLLCGPKS